MELRPTPRFTKSLRLSGSDLKKRTEKSMILFMQDPRHPSLHFEKLYSGLYSLRADLNFRIILRKVEGSTYDLIDLVDHQQMVSKYSRVK